MVTRLLLMRGIGGGKQMACRRELEPSLNHPSIQGTSSIIHRRVTGAHPLPPRGPSGSSGQCTALLSWDSDAWDRFTTPVCCGDERLLDRLLLRGPGPVPAGGPTPSAEVRTGGGHAMRNGYAIDTALLAVSEPNQCERKGRVNVRVI